MIVLTIEINYLIDTVRPDSVVRRDGFLLPYGTALQKWAVTGVPSPRNFVIPSRATSETNHTTQ